LATPSVEKEIGIKNSFAVPLIARVYSLYRFLHRLDTLVNETISISPKKLASLTVRARKLYKQGFDDSQVRKLTGRSHAWFALTVKQFSTN
jgi:hypothetical protein